MYSTPTACPQTVILHRSLFTSYFGITGKCTRNKIIVKGTNFSMTAYMGLLKKCSWLSSHRGNGWQIHTVCTCMHVRGAYCINVCTCMHVWGAHCMYMYACQRCTPYVHVCMSEVQIVCACMHVRGAHCMCMYACQRCTPYVHVCMSEVHTVCTCMHVRGAHRTYMHAYQRCTPYVHVCMPKVQGCWVRDLCLKVFQPRTEMKDLYNMRILPIRNKVRQLQL